LGDRAYLLSPQDLAAHDHIAELLDAGVVSFKIEGRLKGGPYVAATTQTYRRAMDLAQQGTRFQLDAPGRRDLAQTFSRGLTPGFLEGVNHQKLVRGRTPKSRGVRLGEVVARFRNAIRLKLLEPEVATLRAGDGVVFDLGRPQENEPGGRLHTARILPDGFAEIGFGPELDLATIPIGCDVWKTDDPELRQRLEASYRRDLTYRRTPVQATLVGELGRPLTLTYRTATGLSASAEWPGPIVAATHRPTSTEEITASLGRLGETPLELHEVVNQVPPEAMLPKSVLNDLRRRASAELEAALLAQFRHPVAEPDALARLRGSIPTTAEPTEPARLRVLVRTLAQLEAVLAWQPPPQAAPLAGVVCDFEDLRGYRPAVELCRAAQMPVTLAPLRIIKPSEEGFHSPIVRAEPDEVLIRNPGAIRYFQEQLPQARLVGDFGLNVANELAARVFHQAGLIRLTPSYDLNWEQLAAMLRRSPVAWYEPVIHQHMPMFHMEHCVFAAFLSTGKDHRDCGRPCETHRLELRDRVGAEFPVHPDTGCRNTVYNSVPQSAAEYVGRMLELGVRQFRVDLLRETPEAIHELLTNYARLVMGELDGRQLWKQLRALNQLGVTRGTLSLV
jgi:putative protease